MWLISSALYLFLSFAKTLDIDKFERVIGFLFLYVLLISSIISTVSLVCDLFDYRKDIPCKWTDRLGSFTCIFTVAWFLWEMSYGWPKYL